MELFYNPEAMPEKEIKGTFVARQWLVDEIASLIGKQRDGAGVQHVVVIGPRGMGKTTVLLMLRFAIREGALAKKWQPVKFPEESYGINDLADFWLTTLNHLAAETGDAEILKSCDRLKAEYRDSETLGDAAFALLKDWRKKNKKRLVLLVDNLDMILDQIGDERENARLREVLMNDGTVMLIGGATAFFKEARRYDQPLYNFFKVYTLENLKFEDMQDLLRQRAAVDEAPNFEETLKANASRLRALEYFTGGNPRLVLMLYRILSRSEVIEVRRGLQKLLDEVTPYYKAKVESLPPQQRKILDHIARISSQTHEGETPTRIGAAIRMPVNQVSAQLKRLSESGYVKAANVRGRSSCYTLSEPLYAVWSQMRFGRQATQRMQWLVDFLKAWYDKRQIRSECSRLEGQFRELKDAGRIVEAQEVLEFRFYLSEAIIDLFERLGWKGRVFENYREIKGLGATGESPDDTDFRREVLLANRVLRLLTLASDSESQGNSLTALENVESALQLDDGVALSWGLRAFFLVSLGRLKEGLHSFDRLCAIQPEQLNGWYFRGVLLELLNKPEDSKRSFERAGSRVPTMTEVAFSFHAASCCNRLDVARAFWESMLTGWQEEDRYESLYNALTRAARPENVSFLRGLISESNLDEELFPLARAFDFIGTGDDQLIEKLSPEMRPIVVEIVTSIQAKSNQANNPRTTSPATSVSRMSLPLKG